MNTETNATQCPGNGCAAELLSCLREMGCVVFCEGLTGEVMVMNRELHPTLVQAIQAHVYRLNLILLAEWSGNN